MVAILEATGRRAGSPLASYRTDIARRPRLAREAEHDLAARVKRGDREASRQLIEGCLSTVVAVALEYGRSGLPIEDLVQEGNLGLIKAVDHFDASRGLRFVTYAMYWVRAEIRDYVARHYRVVRLGRSKAERRALWLYRRTREDQPEKLAAMSGLSVERATELLPLLVSADLSLSSTWDDGPSLADRLPDHTHSAEARLAQLEEQGQLRAAIDAALSELSARDRDIVERRLLADEPETLSQVGVTWGVSKERVRQLEEAVKKRMARRLEAHAPERGTSPGGRADE